MKRTRLATQDKKRKPLIFCPRRCTQRRTQDNRLAERKTFDPASGRCLNCGFIKINAVNPLLFKASLLVTKGISD